MFLLFLASPVLGETQETGNGIFERVFPDATSFGPLEGSPLARPAFRNDRIVGYVFHTYSVVRSVGLSGKPLDIVVGLDMAGIITGAEILEQHEPILAIGVSADDLHTFVSRFTGMDSRQTPTVHRRAPREDGEIQAVSGATISSLLIADAIYQSAEAVGRGRGILAGAESGIDLTGFEELGWNALIQDGSLQSLRLSVREAEDAVAARGGRLFSQGARPADDTAPFVALTAGLASPARIGRNLLGPGAYNRLVGSLADGDQLIFIAANGLYSFKGTAYGQTGVFDRFQISQGGATFTFRREDYIRIDRLTAEGAPDPREKALFVIHAGSGFDPARAWRLDLSFGGDSDAGPVTAIRSLEYVLPKRYLATSEITAITPPSADLWRNVWLDRMPDIVLLGVVLLSLGTMFFLQDMLARRRRLYQAFRYGFLAITLLWIGWYASAQLSVLNVLTFGGALRTEFRWDFFLLEPLIFMLWAYVAVALLFSGRGAFCGWLCPFGALQELLNRIAQRLRVPQIRVPFALHERLWPIKYIVFLGLFAISLGSIDLAQTGAEIEPFKTAIVLRFLREWPFLLYVGGLLFVGLFIERAFCRYLCPLGAALAIPARIRMFEWLKRRWHCGRQCNICATRCPVQAIHPNGTINPNECIYCLKCQTLYFDETVCPPLLERRKRRETRAVLAAGDGLED